MAKKVRTPKVEDRVTILAQHSNVFAVIKVDKESRSADLILLPHRDFIEKEILWGSLIYMDEEDANQAAARIVRETTDHS